MKNKYRFNYEIITSKGVRIKSGRKFIHRKSCVKVLNKLYPGCVILDITTDGAGGYANQLHQVVGV